MENMEKFSRILKNPPRRKIAAIGTAGNG